MNKADLQLLRQIISIHAPSGDEDKMRDFLLNHIEAHRSNYSAQPELVLEAGFRGSFMLVFGKPRTAVFCHIDTHGYRVNDSQGHVSNIGYPQQKGTVDGVAYAEHATEGIPAILALEPQSKQATTAVPLPIGSTITYTPALSLRQGTLSGTYLDNRLGLLAALKLCETLQHGIIAFTCCEEAGGSTAGILCREAFARHNVRQALVLDVTWPSNDVARNKGIVISLQDSTVPYRRFSRRIEAIATTHQIPFQLEIESSGGSDGSTLQTSDLPVEWCFVGIPISDMHSPKEKASIQDIEVWIEAYRVLMREL